METRYLVRLWPEGAYAPVYARSAKEAAETLYGAPLSEVGNRAQLKALVHHGMISTAIPFYEQ
jgi:hypothetical protein